MGFWAYWKYCWVGPLGHGQIGKSNSHGGLGLWEDHASKIILIFFVCLLLRFRFTVKLLLQNTAPSSQASLEMAASAFTASLTFSVSSNNRTSSIPPLSRRYCFLMFLNYLRNPLPFYSKIFISLILGSFT